MFAVIIYFHHYFSMLFNCFFSVSSAYCFSGYTFVFSLFQVSEDQCREYLRQTGEITISNPRPRNISPNSEGLKALRYNEQKAMYELIRPSPVDSKQGAVLRQRTPSQPSDVVSSEELPKLRNTSSVVNNLETFGSRMLSMFGLPYAGTVRPNLPPGLGGSGDNLCFMNSVLQCIARGPNLADELAEEVKSCSLQDKNKLSLLDAVAETLQQINEMPSANTIPVINTKSLCLAGIYCATFLSAKKLLIFDYEDSLLSKRLRA